MVYFISHYIVHTSIIALMKCCPLSGYVTIGTNFSDLEQTFPIQISVHSIRKDGYCGDFSISLDPEIRERKLRVWQDNILFVVELSTPGNDLDTIASSIENDEYSLSSDLERIRIDEDFSDVTISVKGKNYPAHKLILAARSSVFKAMFKNNMQESQTNHITITDMEQETFEEMLRYIYTGKMPNLEEWAFELLPAADKYDLKELKNACERLLLTEISAENVGKVLVLADMHNADELKAHALLFIKENSADFEPEIWNVLTESRPGLMKDILAILLKK
ncbi:speckle-type POZ protein-like [Planococcus citri]|uniref:speckle-type POZ protein-like n=1 Tax=Planococcus citri TaxID=170843 RepID=UPI0031F910E1